MPKSLYDLAKDIGENENLINSYTERAVKLDQIMVLFDASLKAEARKTGLDTTREMNKSEN
jgi:hypothetical protein